MTLSETTTAEVGKHVLLKSGFHELNLLIIPFLKLALS